MVAISLKKCTELLVLALGVATAERDQLTRVVTVEEEVGEQVGLRSSFGLGHAAHEAAEDAGVALEERRRAHELGGERAEICGRAHQHRRQRAHPLLAGRCAHRLIDLVEEVRAVDAAARFQNLVDAAQAIDVAVETIEEQRVERLAEEKQRTGERLFVGAHLRIVRLLQR